jgi:hypothetical protein
MVSRRAMSYGAIAAAIVPDTNIEMRRIHPPAAPARTIFLFI